MPFSTVLSSIRGVTSVIFLILDEFEWRVAIQTRLKLKNLDQIRSEQYDA